MQPTHKGLTFIVILIFASVAWGQGEDGVWSYEAKNHIDENGVWSYEAKNHIGEIAMVCGVIVSIRRESQLPGAEFKGSYYVPPNPTINGTILYFDRLPPDHEFVAIIHDVNRNAFPNEPVSLVDQKACVYGKISTYKGKAAVALIRADQIAVVGKGKDSK